MDTSPLEEKIKALELEIQDDQKKIDLLKQNVDMTKKALKVYKSGLEKLKGKEK